MDLPVVTQVPRPEPHVGAVRKHRLRRFPSDGGLGCRGGQRDQSEKCSTRNLADRSSVDRQGQEGPQDGGFGRVLVAQEASADPQHHWAMSVEDGLEGLLRGPSFSGREPAQ